MRTGDLSPAQEGQRGGGLEGLAGGSPHQVQEASRRGRLRLDQWSSREGKGFHPAQKGTFTLPPVRLKIASPKESLGWGGSWRLLKIVPDSELRAMTLTLRPPLLTLYLPGPVMGLL